MAKQRYEEGVWVVEMLINKDDECGEIVAICKTHAAADRWKEAAEKEKAEVGKPSGQFRASFYEWDTKYV